MVDHICPKPGAVPFNEYQICVIEWFMKRSNSYLDYTQLSTAVSQHPEDCSPRRRWAGPRQAGCQASRQARAGACALPLKGAGHSPLPPPLPVCYLPSCLEGRLPPWPPQNRPLTLSPRPPQMSQALQHMSVWAHRLYNNYTVSAIDISEMRPERDLIDVI